MTDTIKIARMHDPAFAGLPVAEVAAYARSRDSEDLPAALPGTSPEIYHFKRLTRSQVLDIVGAMPDDLRRFNAAFMCGLVKVTGGRFGESGWAPEQASDPRAPVRVTDAEIEACDFSVACMEDLGGVLYLRSVSPKGSSPRYPVRPTSLAVLEGLDHPSAEQKRADAAQPSAERAAE